MRRLLGALFIVSGAALLLHSATKARESGQLRQSAVEEAVIMRKELFPASRQGPHETIFRVWYRYKGMAQAFEVNAERFEALQEGGTLAVVALPGKPQSVRPLESLDSLDAIGKGLAGAALFAAGAIVFWRPWTRSRSKKRVAVAPAGSVAGKTWRIVQFVILCVIAFTVAAALAELPLVRRFDDWTEENFMACLAGAGFITLTGLGLMIGSLLVRADYSAEFSIAEMMQAFGSEAFTKPEWRSRMRIVLGALLILVGIAAVIFFSVPAPFKVLSIGACAYGGGRAAFPFLRVK